MSRFIRNYFILLSIFYLVSCENSSTVVVITGETMGTSYTVKYLPPKVKINASKLSQSIEKLLIDFNKVASTYIDESEISKINRSSANQEIRISREFKKLFLSGAEISRNSEGYFDPSIGPLVNLWGFGPKGKVNNIPLNREIEEAKKYIGIEKFKVIERKNILIKENKSQFLDFSAYAKGRGVDLVAALLSKAQIKDFMVEIGGELKTRSSSKIWNVGIERPSIDRKSFQIISLSGGAVATSGDYRNTRNISNRIMSHGISFKSGAPKENMVASVSVYDSESCMRADAWATALMVAGEGLGPKLAEKNGIAAYFIYKKSNNSSDYLVHRTSMWKSLVKEK